MRTDGLPKEVDLNGARILITGASGWLGVETLCLLNNMYPGFQGLTLTLAGSQRRIIDVHGHELSVVPISEILTKDSFDLILHLAFATQDKLSSLGSLKYIEINSELNQWISRLSSNNPNAKKLILSSGAVSRYIDSKYDETSMGVYAHLKSELESNFHDAESVVLRLWNTSGHHMGTNTKYALGEFIMRASKGLDILVQKNLRRSYVSAPSVLNASISYLLNGGHGIVNSGGELTRLHNLANLVVNVLNSDSNVSMSSSKDFPELDYVSPETEIPSMFWTNYLDLPAQIRNTAAEFN